MRRSSELCLWAGAVVPPAFAVAVAVLTVIERSFLGQSGWSAVHRTRTEWPSLLALGPGGFVLEIALVGSGMLLLAFGWALAISDVGRRSRSVGICIAVGGVALSLEAFEADAPSATRTSWHAAVHNGVYPAIPAAAIVAAGLLSFGPKADWQQLSRRWSVPVVVVLLVGLAGTNVDAVAQLARYFLFGAMLIWLELLAVDAIRASRSAPDASAKTASGCSCSTS